MSKTLASTKKKITAEQTVLLVRLFKKYKCLWDPCNSDFRNRKVRRQTYEKIGSYFGLSGLDIRRRLRQLRTRYKNEVKLIRDGQKQESSFFYFDEMNFLRDQILKELLVQTPPPGSDLLMAKDILDKKYPSQLQEEHHSLEEYLEHQQPLTNDLEMESSSSIQISELEIDKLPEFGDEDDVQENLAEEGKSDEFDVFAGYLASQLREMDKLSAVETMEELQQVISKRRIEILKKNLKIKNKPAVYYRYMLKKSKSDV